MKKDRLTHHQLSGSAGKIWRLFLTGPIGCGKSTAIRRALGDQLPRCGGFLTRRYREPHLHFTVESPDGKYRKTFLDFSSGKPEADLSVFSEISLTGKALILDEIGGIELLDPVFSGALETLLHSDTPILGVIKAEGSADILAETLGLSEEYRRVSSRLRKQLETDPGTLVYQCGLYDETALLLARQWVEDHLHD